MDHSHSPTLIQSGDNTQRPSQEDTSQEDIELWSLHSKCFSGKLIVKNFYWTDTNFYSQL